MSDLPPLRDPLEVLRFTVMHEPEQVGSKNAFVVYSNRAKKIPARRPDGSIIVSVTDENEKAKPYMKAVALAAARAAEEAEVFEHPDLPFELEVTFFLRRPQSHWRTGRNAALLKDSAPARPITYPDEDKLLRCTQDALEGIVWKNDSQVVRAVAEKRYAVPSAEGDNLRAEIVIRRHPEVLASDLPEHERVRAVALADADAGEQIPLVAPF